MKIYLLRHGSTLEGENGIILGQKGGNLSEKGIKEMEKVGNYLKSANFGIKKIYSSSLKRAIDSADIINDYLNLELEKCEILNERLCGKSEGKKESEIDWEIYEKKKLAYRKHDGGESFLEVRKRAKVFLESVKNNNFDSLIVSHSVFILMLIGLIQKKSIEKSLEFDISGKIVCVEVEMKNPPFAKRNNGESERRICEGWG